MISPGMRHQSAFCILIFIVAAHLTAAAQPEQPHLVSHIRRQQIESSALRSAGYSRRRHILEIEFLNGAIYRYYNIEASVYRDFINAHSKAGYYDSNIRYKYVSARVKPQRMDRPPH